MPKLSINLLRWNSPYEMIKEAMDHALDQDFEDYELVYSENADSGQPTLLEQIQKEYGSNKKVRIVNNRGNLGYAGGHNKFFETANSDLVMVLNPDAKLQKTFLSNIVKAFNDPKVGMATGKMLKPETNEKGEHLIDGTGIVIFKSRRAQERGQLEIDHGQYDNQTKIFGVSGTAALYRKEALEKIKVMGEYFDPDFFAYWEDLDLSWRLRLQGYDALYVPSAVVYHSRAVGKSPRGYKDPISFVKHHSQFSLNVRRWNWRNHLFAIIKNDFGWSLIKGLPFILLREIAMIGYITIFEPKTWTVLPTFFKLLPKMLNKRKIIQSKRTVSSAQMSQWF